MLSNRFFLRISLLFVIVLIALGQADASGWEKAPYVVTTPREIPVAFEVDVAIVGGSTGAVAAAVEAAQQGAKVFLAAPNPYLGEDMTATLRLWANPDEVLDTPLAKAIFAERRKQVELPEADRMLPFTYTVDRESAAAHKDTKPLSLLADKKWGAANNQSVQYPDDATVTLDLGKEKDIAKCYLMVYHQPDFQVAGATFFKSANGVDWQPLGEVVNRETFQGRVDVPAIPLAVDTPCRTRYLKCAIRKVKSVTRMLIGEIAVIEKGGRAVVKEAPQAIPPARPLYIKKLLESALIDAGVQFLYPCMVTDVLKDAQGKPAGIVIANRSGRQAVTAKVVIDATDYGTAAQQAGARFASSSPARRHLKRVVVGGKVQKAQGMTARIVAPPFWRNQIRYDIIEYAMSLPWGGDSFADYAQAEQRARDRTFDPDQQFTGDAFFQVPCRRIQSQNAEKGAWPGADALDLKACRPEGLDRLFVLSGCVDISRTAAEAMLRPPALIKLGMRVGRAAAALAKGLPVPVKPCLPGENTDKPVAGGDVHEFLAGIHPASQKKFVPAGKRPLPVLGKYEVVVIGGGTSGAPAAIGAARRGAKTLVVELLHGMGGVGTQGAISKYYWGNRVGFSATVAHGASWRIEEKTEWWRTTVRKAGADIWFGAMGCGVLMDGNRVTGAVIATPLGRGVVLADVVVDATGNSDMAAAAGAACYFTDAKDIAMQGTGLPPRQLGASYTNTDFTIVDETSVLDAWHVFVYVKHKVGNAFDLGRLIDTRERRRIVGGFTVSIIDQINDRTFPDTICETYSDFDTHGYTVHPYFTLQHPPHRKGFLTRIPYRCLLPEGLEGIIVTGLGVSAQRDAIPLIRMQPDIQNQGYAAGTAAAMVAKKGLRTRELDVKALQKHLVEIGSLKKAVLTAQDSYPMPEERIVQAVEAIKDEYKDVAVLLAHLPQAMPLLKKAYQQASTEADRLIYAKILAVLGDKSGVDTLIKALKAAPDLGDGWRYTGMGQYGHNMGPVDRLIYALGCAGDKRALPAILEKLKLLKPEDPFSHFRAISLSLEKLGDPQAAGALHDLLGLPGIQGHAAAGIKQAIERARKFPSMTATKPRSNAIRELILGRTLYRCGDRNGLGEKILKAYVKDLRGHLSRHAKAVLEERKSIP